ncbi:MAG: bifunctional helix-turn-helix domain-containing protein/methylated-DNA--[protein]-cysteine S-methyltransferase [Pseudomonadales bacterium]
MKTSLDSRHYQIIEKALRFIQQQQKQQPKLAEIAGYCALSECHFQRIFNQWAGVSPKQFLQHLTREDAKTRLLNGDSLLATSSCSGLSSSSRLHDLFVTLEAVTPGEIKSAGEGLQFLCGLHNSPFGKCFIVTTKRGIHRLDFIDTQPLETLLQELQEQWPSADIVCDEPATAPLIDNIFKRRVKRAPKEQKLKLWLKGSQFQFKVWEALLRIPNGSLCSYGTIAKSIGQPTAARAVGSAVAKNSVALLIPCHRVIQEIGNLGNYRWGETRKQALVGWEAAQKN